MIAPVRDDRIYGLRYMDHTGDEGVGELALIADRGALKVSVKSAGGVRGRLTLDLSQVDGLIESLPKLRDWLVSGEPAASTAG